MKMPPASIHEAPGFAGSIPDVLFRVLHIEGFLHLAKTNEVRCAILYKLVSILRRHRLETDSDLYTVHVISLSKRRADLQGKCELFRDQAETFAVIADLYSETDNVMALEYYQRARRIGEEHGFFRIECMACRGIGDIYMLEGRFQDGMDLLRNAVAAASLCVCEGNELLMLESGVLFTILSHLVLSVDTWSDEEKAEVDKLTLRHCEVELLLSQEDDCGMESWATRVWYLLKCGGDNAETIGLLEKILDVVSNSLESESKRISPRVKSILKWVVSAMYKCDEEWNLDQMIFRFNLVLGHLD